MFIRQGDLLIERVDSIPKNLTAKKNTVLLEGETIGHFHKLEKAKVYEVSESSEKYLLGYFEVEEEETALVHPEHNPIKFKKGIYRFYAQREYDEQEERRVID